MYNWMQVGEFMLQPEKLAKLARKVEDQHGGQINLPKDVYGEGVKKQLSALFDQTQFAAIAVSNAHPPNDRLGHVIIRKIYLCIDWQPNQNCQGKSLDSSPLYLDCPDRRQYPQQSSEPGLNM